MKFDLIVGNPPYEGSGKPLYLQILAALMPFGKEVVWICPSQWTKAWKDDDYVESVKRDELNCLIGHENIENPFEEADLPNLAVYHFKKDNAMFEDYEELKYEKFQNVDLAKRIISKLEAHESIYEHVWENNGSYYVTFSILKGHHDNGKYKNDWLILMPDYWREDYSKKDISAGKRKKRCQFSFSTLDEARNFRMSTETDIAMFALFVHKVNRNIYPNTISYIPWLGDYTRSWTDEDIAEELGLTKEELDYIHEEMKNFGWKCAKRTKK